MKCLIAIPTFNRARQVRRAVEAALAQSYDDATVAVIDDGSTDDTHEALAPFLNDPRFVYAKLAKNVGTAKAKNVALAMLDFDAVSFHDSDDIPHRDKLLLQQRVLAQPNVMADECLNWAAAQKAAGARIDVDVALTHHELLMANGSVHRISRTLSLVDDFFPQLQMAAGPPGDWILINSGLFRRAALAKVGGYSDTIEEDRDLRNRLIMSGAIIWVIDRPLVTKIESADSLTVGAATNYASQRRVTERTRIWDDIARWRKTGDTPVHEIDLAGIEIAFSNRPDKLRLCTDLPVTNDTYAWFAAQSDGVVRVQ